jgi:GDP-L-fucose synthase
MKVPGRYPDLFHPSGPLHRGHLVQSRACDPARHAVPTLLERDSHAGNPNHATPVWPPLDHHFHDSAPAARPDHLLPVQSPEMSSAIASQTILVTGAHGFLGRAVLAALDHRGAGDVISPTSAEYDLRDSGQATGIIADASPDLVIHLAARVGGIGANQARPADLYLDNLLMGTNIIEAARQAGTPKIVIAGTICSYPKFTPVPFKEESLWEGYPEETNAPYGVAKLAQLVQLQANRAQYGQNGIYVMPTNLYGPGDKFHPDVSHVIPALIKKCIDAREAGADHLEVWGTGNATREFLYVDDAAEGILRAAERYEGGEPVNLGANRETPIRELVELIGQVTGFDGEIRWDTTKPDGQPRRCVDPSRAREAFGFEASMALEEGLRRTVDWYLAHRDEAEARQS